VLKGINLSHFLEHFPIAIGARILMECHRVLSPSGVIRISCPDLRRYAEAYVRRDESFFAGVSGPAFCRYDGLASLGDRFASKAYDNDGRHQWFYDAESVMSLLEKAGFLDIAERRVHESRLPNVEQVEPAYRARESFYVEAIS
jgi:predicted SAM-dependent methyltransferase